MDHPVGTPEVQSAIPLCVPQLAGNEWRYLKDCLETNWVSYAGPYVNRFEQEFGEYLGVPHAVATNSGTAALHIALLVAGIRPNDEVLVSTLSFIAPANAIRYAGAWPVFIDAEPEYWQMDAARARTFLEESCQRGDDGLVTDLRTGRTVRAIMPVHVLGHPCDMGPLLELAREFGLVVIEDATEALGARYREQAVGTHGDIACFSFNGNKLITTGGGGMLTTRNPEWAIRARHLTTQAKADPIEYVHDEIGYNYRLTNLQAALGCAQLELLDSYIAVKRRIAATYADALANAPGLSPMPEAPWADSTFWMYTVRVDPDGAGMTSREMLSKLDAIGIQTRPLWQPLHMSTPHAGAPAAGGAVAESLYERALSLPCSVGLGADQERVVDAVLRLLAN